MAKKDYVPRTHKGFNSWQKTIADHVIANAAAWGIPNALVTELTTWKDDFRPLYEAIDNRNTSTFQQIAAFNAYRIEYTTFLRKLVQSSLVNSIVVPYDMKIAMGLNPRKGGRPERPSIASRPMLGYKSLGGAKIYFECSDSEDGRKARPENSDGVEFYITVGTSKPVPTPVEPQQGAEAPVAEVKGTEFVVQSSKARFSYQFKLEDRGKEFSACARWYNNNDRAKDGTIGPTLIGFIS